MEKTEEGYPVSYIGDGVYAIYDGFGIWLHTRSHDNPKDKIYLEPAVLTELDLFNKKVS